MIFHAEISLALLTWYLNNLSRILPDIGPQTEIRTPSAAAPNDIVVVIIVVCNLNLIAQTG